MLKRKIIDFSRQGKKYTKIIKWLLLDAFFKGFWGKPCWIFLFSGLRLLCQAAAITVLYFYANALKSDGLFTFYTFDLPARESTLLMWVIIILSFLLFSLAALFQYVARIKSIALACEYEEQSATRALEVISRLPNPGTSNLNEQLKKGSYRRISGDARRTGMIVRSIGYTVPQLFSASAGAFLILYIDPLLTILIGGLTLCVFVGQYPANIKGAIQSQQFEESVPRMHKSATELIKYFIENTYDFEKNKVKIRRHFNNKNVQNAIQSFGGRLRVIEESTMITQIGSALIIAVTVFIIGSRLLKGGYNWGLLLAYIASLRACLSAVVQIGRTLTGVSRFYYQIGRFYNIIESVKLFDKPHSHLSKDDVLVLCCKKDGSKNELIHLPVKARYAIYTMGSIDRSILHILNHSNINSSEGDKKEFTAPIHFIGKNMDGRLIKRLKGEYHNDYYDVLFIEASALSEIQSALKNEGIDFMITFIIYNSLNSPPNFNEQVVLFCHSSELIGYANLKEDTFDQAIAEFEAQIKRLRDAGHTEINHYGENEDDEF